MRELGEAGRRQVLAPVFIARAQQVARRLQQIVLAVLHVVFAEAVAVADGHYLHVGTRQQFHGDGLALAAEADAGQRNAVARGHKGRAQHVPGHDHESSRGPRECAARELAIAGMIHRNLPSVANATRIIIVLCGGWGGVVVLRLGIAAENWLRYAGRRWRHWFRKVYTGPTGSTEIKSGNLQPSVVGQVCADGRIAWQDCPPSTYPPWVNRAIGRRRAGYRLSREKSLRCMVLF